MRVVFVLSVLVTALAGNTSHGVLYAQNVTPEETVLSPMEPTADRIETVINAPDPVRHAGLLGKIYLQNRYRYQNIDNKAVGDSWQGYDTLLNLPAITLNTPTPLDVDVFAGYVNMDVHGDRWYRPDLKSEAFNVGASIYPTISSQFRPFVQVGARFVKNEAVGNSNAWAGFPFNAAPIHQVDHDTSLILNGGFEYDLFDSLAYRMTLFTETQDRFQDSVMSHDLILWPVNKIFIRSGIYSNLNGDHMGFMVGGGLAF